MNVKNQSKRNCADTALPILHAPLSAPGLTQFCRDIERLFRINPMLNVRHWRCLDANRYFFAGQNISQPMPFDFELILTVRQLSNGLQIEYDQGVKSRTTFTIDPIRALPGSSFTGSTKVSRSGRKTCSVICSTGTDGRITVSGAGTCNGSGSR